MKRTIIVTIILSLALFVSSTTVFANEISVVIDGQRIEFQDQPPIIIDGSTFVPIRAAAEHIGLTVTWNQAAQTVNLLSNDVAVGLQAGSNLVLVADARTGMEIRRHTLNASPRIHNGRLILPIRVIMEEFGCEVDWDPATRTIDITTTEATWSQMSRTIVIGE